MLKIQIFAFLFRFFSAANLEKLSDEQEESSHQHTMEMEKRYQDRWDPVMMENFACVSLEKGPGLKGSTWKSCVHMC